LGANPAPYEDALQAMRLASAALPDLGRRPNDLRVVSAEQMLGGAGGSTARWRIGFKAIDLFPRGGRGKVGAGGELFVEVDLASRDARLARGGD
jgi:hypothetical protein